MVSARMPGGGSGGGGEADVLAAWAEGLGRRRGRACGRGCLRFAFYGRVSTEDWQDPVTSQARQLQRAAMLTAGHGVIVAEFFDAGVDCTLAEAVRTRQAGVVRPPARDPSLPVLDRKSVV